VDNWRKWKNLGTKGLGAILALTGLFGLFTAPLMAGFSRDPEFVHTLALAGILAFILLLAGIRIYKSADRSENQ